MSNITPFSYEGREVRTLDINGEPWFVTGDVCDYFGVTNRNRVMQHVDPEDKGGTQIDTPGGRQTVSIVNESGLYTLLFHLQPTKARGLTDSEVEAKTALVRSFRRWVTHEVLPAIRRTGTYATRPQPQLSGKELLAAAVLEAAETIKQHEATIAQQAEDLAKALPKANTWDALCSGRGDHSITDAAKLLSSAGIATGPRKLHKQLQDLGWIHKNQRDKWAANQDRLNTGLLAEKVRHYIDDDGVSVLATPQVRVTPKGLEKLHELLAPAGLQEVLA